MVPALGEPECIIGDVLLAVIPSFRIGSEFEMMGSTRSQSASRSTRRFA